MEDEKTVAGDGDSVEQFHRDADADRLAEPTYQKALSETRRVIDVQIEMVENTDKEILTVMRLNLLTLGGIVTLIAYVPDLIASALPWVAVSVFLLICSLLTAAFIYRGVTLYAGFGDHGYDAHTPEQKIRYGSLIRPTKNPSSLDDNNSETDTTPTTFYTALLNEHQSGISHNNIEIKYRSQIHQQIILLILTSILILGIGLITSIADISSRRVLVLVLLVTSTFFVGAVYTIIKSIGLISRFIQTNADPNRLSYGYAFDRQYPYLSLICSFVTTYLYDPVTEEW